MALIFVNAADTVVVGYTVKFIRYISVFNAELALLFTARYSVQGMGYGKYSILSGLAEMAGRAAVAVLLIHILALMQCAGMRGLRSLQELQ